MMKLCNKCEVEKDIIEFQFDKSKNCYSSSCKECRARILREKRQLNREEYNKKTRIWIEGTRDRQRKNRLEWKLKNPDKTKMMNIISNFKKTDNEHFEFFENGLTKKENMIEFSDLFQN